MLMKKLSFNKPLLVSLITAFLFLQWSSTHIHLASEHEHDSGQHQHQVTTHQHQLTSHHTDAIDIASDTLSHADNHKVVDLEYVCTQFHGKQGKLFTVIPSTLWNVLERKISSKSVVTSYQQGNYQNYHQYTSIRLRAPPLAS